MYLPCPAILELGPDFYDAVEPASFSLSIARFLNHEKATELGLDQINWKKHFCDFKPLEKNLLHPLALRYHGHQFQYYNPDLGDGRGFLFAQVKNQIGKLVDFGTKGSGQTPYSRAGDGRLTLKGAFRESLATELLESYGATTSKTFCFYETGENLDRSDEPSPTRSAVLTRLSHGHIRIGTFQRLAFLKQPKNILRLLDYCVKYYYPEILHTSDPSSLTRASQFLQAVSFSLAQLSAQYMMTGFVHGVLNSDNINITGESFDYGPYRWLPEYNPNFTAAYFDHQGLYRYGQQPAAIHWNLQQLADSLLLAFPDLEINQMTSNFGQSFSESAIKIFFRRLNLKSKSTLENEDLLSHFFLFMSDNHLHFEQTFFDLFGGLQPERLRLSPQAKDYLSDKFFDLSSRLQKFNPANEALLNHPYFKNDKPCTLLIGELESIWLQIEQNDDWSYYENKIKNIRSFRKIY